LAGGRANRPITPADVLPTQLCRRAVGRQGGTLVPPGQADPPPPTLGNKTPKAALLPSCVGNGPRCGG